MFQYCYVQIRIIAKLCKQNRQTPPKLKLIANRTPSINGLWSSAIF